MKCVRCGSEDTKVLESRLSQDGRSIRRRRECRNCARRSTTYEKEESFVFHIRKKDGQIQPYERDKALRSIQIACKKRPLKLDEMEFMLSKVESKIQEIGESVVASHQLGNLLLAALYEVDLVAYVRFASVYKDFKDLNEFLNLLNSLK